MHLGKIADPLLWFLPLSLLLGACGIAAPEVRAPRVTPEVSLAGLPAAPAAIPTLRVVPVSSRRFEHPIAAIAAPDRPGRWHIVEQGGRVVRLDAGERTGSIALFADFTTQVDSASVESGLLGFAFDPRYAQTARVYVSSVGKGLVSRLSRFAVVGAGDRIDPGSEQVLLELQQPGDVHNGGKIVFGPDGNLYMGFGDGAQGLDPFRHGQNPDTLFGTILRLDVSGGGGYRIPPDNPFVGGGGRPEVYAYGFRNPWGIAFDRESGALWVADVGENEREEVDVVVAGGNYGWSVREGTRCVWDTPCGAPGLVDPVYEYTHDSGCSIIGGTVYRGTAIAWLRGAYVFSDWCAGTLWALFRGVDGRPVARVLADTGYRVTAINEDAAGELHLLDYADGGFYRLEP